MRPELRPRRVAQALHCGDQALEIRKAGGIGQTSHHTRISRAQSAVMGSFEGHMGNLLMTTQRGATAMLSYPVLVGLSCSEIEPAEFPKKLLLCEDDIFNR